MAQLHLPQVDAVRRFNRFYTRQIGVLREGLLDSPFSLAEARVLYELAHRKAPTAGELGRDLGMDAGYLSRILRRLERDGLLAKEKAKADGRRSLLHITRAGRSAFAKLETRSRADVGAMIAPLGQEDRTRLCAAMDRIESLLAPAAAPAAPFVLRPHRPGDLGWIVHRHAVLYTEEYGWSGNFEALVARVAADFIDNFKPGREQCWIAERDGEIVGSVMLVEKSKTVAKLRLLLVEPKARGLGIGRHLVEECLRFARRAGYRKITLWTNDVLTAARRLYEKFGFTLVEERPHRDFGIDMVGETWELRLDTHAD